MKKGEHGIREALTVSWGAAQTESHLQMFDVFPPFSTLRGTLSDVLTHLDCWSILFIHSAKFISMFFSPLVPFHGGASLALTQPTASLRYLIIYILLQQLWPGSPSDCHERDISGTPRGNFFWFGTNIFSDPEINRIHFDGQSSQWPHVWSILVNILTHLEGISHICHKCLLGLKDEVIRL